MDAAILIGLGVLLCGWAFTTGKREGSRKGYHAGRQQEKRSVRKWFRRRS
jgi:hypothetical protein